MPELIDIHAIINQFATSCNSAQSEDDIKAASNIFFYDVGQLFDIKVTSHNEYTSAHGGRIDSIFNDIYFEYKKLRLFRKVNNDGIKEAVYGRGDRDHGLFHYLINFSLEECHNDEEIFVNLLTSKIGVGFDGERFVFCRFKRSDSKMNLFQSHKTKNFPSNVSKEQCVEFECSSPYNFEVGVKRILLYLRSTKKLQLTSNSLCKSFSNTSLITQKVIPYLYSLLEISIETNTRIKTLYEEWDRIFGTIYGNVESDFVRHINAVKAIYPIHASNLDVKIALFVIQTYYSIIIKLLIQNLFANLKMPTSVASAINDKSDLIKLFSGQQGDFNLFIDNFFEINFFEWFTLAENFDISIINDIILELDKYESTASVIKPEVVGDVLKETYESLMPKDLRHLMGEYYTVEWLADFTIEKSGYDAGENTTVLDPTCGSGIFLTHLIKRYRNKYNKTLSFNQMTENIISNFVGFDINPIAVIQAKGNYILSLGDITYLANPITIPVYMCDSILVPTVHAKQTNGNDSIDIRTSVGDFRLPILQNREASNVFLNVLSNCILTDYTNFEIFERLLEVDYDIKLDDSTRKIARNLFNQLLDLHYAGKDGFWPIILKNSFAPLFCEHNFDYVIGNPPWIAWKAMSESYRELTLDIWLSYGIFEKNAYDKITSHDDFAMAVTYVAIDHYLKMEGTAALILPQTFVKSLKGGEGFRKFLITRDNQEVPFAVQAVYDMLRVNPFRGIANNKTSVYVFKKGISMEYPMENYYEYSIKPTDRINYKMSYSTVENRLLYNRLSAKPINDGIRSPWLTLPSYLTDHLESYLGDSSYKGRKGIEPCGAKGIYLVKVIERFRDLLKIENLIERSRLQAAKDLGVHSGLVESDLVYPMVGGRNIDKWGIKDYIYMVVPHNCNGEGIYRGIPVESMQIDYPKTYQWLYYFHDLLRDTRIRSGKFFDINQFPWYRLDNVGEYTFKPYKVLWQEQARRLDCCVVSTLSDDFIEDKIVVTDSKVLSVSFDSEYEAHYLCAILNSKDIELIIQGYTINTNRGTDIVKNIRIPKFSNKNPYHIKVAELSIEAHKAYIDRNSAKLQEIEAIINDLIHHIFG